MAFKVKFKVGSEITLHFAIFPILFHTDTPVNQISGGFFLPRTTPALLFGVPKARTGKKEKGSCPFVGFVEEERVCYFYTVSDHRFCPE